MKHLIITGDLITRYSKGNGWAICHDKQHTVIQTFLSENDAKTALSIATYAPELMEACKRSLFWLDSYKLATQQQDRLTALINKIELK